MDTPVLHATSRTVTGKQVKQLRRQGQLPAVVYGQGKDSQSITVDSAEFGKLFRKAGTSTLVDLVIDDKKAVKVLLHEPQIHPAKSHLIHADFFTVKMNEKLQTEIPLHFVGESEAVDTLDGTLTVQLDAVMVECFPDKLVQAIEVDITPLKTFEDIIRVSDIHAPEGIEILADAEEVVALVTAPRSEEEMAALDEAISGEDADRAAVEGVEVEEKNKNDETTDIQDLPAR